LKKKKIHTALESLDIYELNAFSKFIDSPYFNQNEKISNYFHLLETAIRNGEDLTEIEDQTAWEYCTKEPYEDVKFRKLSSDLYKLFQKFLAQKQFDKNEFQQIIARIKEYQFKKNDIFYSDIEKDFKNFSNKSVSISSNDILNDYLMNRSLFGLNIEYEKKHKSFKGDIFESLKNIEHDLDKFYLIEKLRIYSTLISWSRINKVELNFNRFEKFISRIAKSLFEDVPAIKIYNNVYQLLTNSDSNDRYVELKNLIKENKYFFDSSELKEIYESAFSYGLGKLNKGDNSILDDLLDLYIEALKDDILLSDGELSPTTFRNITGLALRANRFQWVSNFIHLYSEKINEKYRDNAIYFNTARLKFYQRKYGEVVENLQKVTYEDIWYNLNTRTLLTASYYELEEFDVLDSHLTSFKTFLNREKSLGSRKTHYLHLIKYVKYLINTNYNDQKRLQDLRQQVLETQGVVNKQWLLEKIDTLIK